MDLINIYVLINPDNGHPFYVGSTASHPEVRVRDHMKQRYTTRMMGKKTKERILFINDLLAKGKCISFFVIESVKHNKANESEEFYYNLFISLGFDMLQSNNRFYSYSGKPLAKNKYRKTYKPKVLSIKCLTK